MKGGKMLYFKNLNSVHNIIVRIIDEVEDFKRGGYQEIDESSEENVFYLIYLHDMFYLIKECKRLDNETFDKNLLKEKLEDLYMEKMIKRKTYYFYNLEKILGIAKCSEHLKAVLQNQLATFQ